MRRRRPIQKQACFADHPGPKVVHRGAQESHLQQMASAGFGAILAPEHAPRLPSLAAIPIEGDPVRRKVQLLAVAGRQYSPALDAFIKVARVRDWTSALDRTPPRICQRNDAPFTRRRRKSAMVTRGFAGRQSGSELSDRNPPGQHLVDNFPVLTAGPTPRIEPADWTFTLKVGPHPIKAWKPGRSSTRSHEPG